MHIAEAMGALLGLFFVAEAGTRNGMDLVDLMDTHFPFRRAHGKRLAVPRPDSPCWK